MPQLTQEQIRQALQQGVSPLQIESFMKTGQASSVSLPDTVKKVTQSRYQSKDVFGKASDTINTLWDKFKNLPVIKQVSQAVGAGVGTLGAIEGGIIGAGGQLVTNAIRGDSLGKDVISSAIKTGKSTAEFGYNLGKEGTPAAALGGLGSLPNLAVAYSQGYQGIKDLNEGGQEGDIEKQITGAIELGTSLFGAKNVTKGNFNLKNSLINPQVYADLKSIPSSVRANAYNKVFNNTVNAYREIINQTPKEFQLDMKYGKNTPEFLAKEGIILKGEGGKLNMTEAISQLRERADALDDSLTESLQSRPAKFDLFILGERAKRVIKEDKTILAKDKTDAVNTIDDYVRAEVNAQNRFLDGQGLNQFKRNLWQDSFSADKSRVTNDTLFKLGHEAKTMLEKAFDDQAIKSINAELGNYASAIRFLSKANGRNIKGGMLGKLIYKGIGAIAGGVTGSPIGALAGAEIAGKASDVIRNPSLRTGVRQRVLEKLKPKP